MANGNATKTTELARVEPRTTQAMNPIAESRMAVTARSLNDVYKVAEAVALTGLYGVRSPEDAFVRMLTGLELGLGMAQSLRGVYVIENRPSLDASLMMGVCLSHTDICEYFVLVESSAEKATYETKRRGAPRPVTMTYSKEDAVRAGLWTKKGPWQNHPANMLRARASSNLARAVYPDLLNGLYTPDEIEDIGHVSSSASPPPAPFSPTPTAQSAAAPPPAATVAPVSPDDAVAHCATLATADEKRAYIVSIKAARKAWTKDEETRALDAIKAQVAPPTQAAAPPVADAETDETDRGSDPENY